MLPGSSRMVSVDYQGLAKDKYAAEVFAGVGLKDVNGWVDKKTEGKIPKILDELNPDAKAVLLNAIYFKARWASTFAESLTKNDAFNLSAAQKIQVPTMRQTRYHTVVARQGYRAIRLPYEIEALAMVIALPNEIEGLAEVAGRLNADELSALLASVNTASAKLVELTMPPFKMSFEAELVPVFKQLGMTLAFNDDQADFSGMTGRTASECLSSGQPKSECSLKISEIKHRARIDVMEEGSEAAAATAVVLGPEIARAPGKLPQPEPFHVDRPFLFFIADRTTGAVLFHGRLVDPR
jgi:serpin B